MAETASERRESIRREFGRRLKAAREAAGFDSAELFAFAFGVEPHTYRHWERGDHEPDLTTLQRLCLILHVSANDLLPVDERSEGDRDVASDEDQQQH
jgi:transcriptional regulator with XRE-family HTH domain